MLRLYSAAARPGEYCRLLRAALQWSQQRMADELGVTATCVSNWECERGGMKRRDVAALKWIESEKLNANHDPRKFVGAPRIYGNARA